MHNENFPIAELSSQKLEIVSETQLKRSKGQAPNPSRKPAARLDPGALIVGELLSDWEEHAGPLRESHPQVAVVVQWPTEEACAFAARATSQIKRRGGAKTVVLACNGRLDRDVIQARSRILEAVTVRAAAGTELVLVVPCEAHGGMPAWVASLADRLRFRRPELSVTIRTTSTHQAA